METETKSAGSANGTYRRLAPAEVAWMVKELRTHFGLKQLALAQDAGVTERTIERIEAGIAVSDDTLRKVAKALKLSENAFTQATYCPSDEELATQVKKIRDEHTVTDLHDLSEARQLENLMGQHGHLIDGSALVDSLADSMAALQDTMQDWGDIFGEISAADKLAACRQVLALVREIEGQEYAARWGRYTTADKCSVGVLVFFRRSDLQSPEHLRKAIVPRWLFRDVRT
jgi:transcriptional regulator with XRE-family HTH domain